MPLNLGSTAISALRLGTATPSKVMLGTNQVWPVTGGELWTPADLPQLAGWWDARDNSTIDLASGKVVRWRDKSPVGRLATQNNAASQYTLSTINGHQVVVSTNGRWMPFSPVTTVTGESGAFFVARIQNTGAQEDGTLISGSSPGAFQLRGRINAGNIDLSVLANNVAPIHDSSFPAGAAELNIYGYGVNVSSSVLYCNGTAGTTGGGRAESHPQAWLTTNFAGTPGFTETLEGPLGEIVLTDVDSITSDRQKLEGYMAHGWGIAASLPANHPYKNSPPTK